VTSKEAINGNVSDSEPSPDSPQIVGARGVATEERAPARARDEIAGTLRSRLQELAPTRIDLVVESLDAALQAKKSARGFCGTCKKSVNVEVNDPIAAVNAFKALLEATEGRPGQAADALDSALLVRRVGRPGPAGTLGEPPED